jgi:hypothetical protein
MTMRAALSTALPAAKGTINLIFDLGLHQRRCERGVRNVERVRNVVIVAVVV